jgi:hypothetical protein
VGLLDLGSFLSTPQTSKSFELPNFLTPRIRVRIAWVVEIEGHLFLGKQITDLSPVTHIKLGVTVLIVFYRFSLLPSYLSLPSPFTTPWLTPLSMTPVTPCFYKILKLSKLMLFPQNNNLIGLHFMACIFIFLSPRSILLFAKI